MSIESVMPTKHLILCCPLFLLPPSFPSVRSFSMSQLFTSGGQSIGVSASSVLSMNNQLLQVVLEKQICEATHTAISEVGALLLFIFSFSELYLCVCAQSLSHVWLCSLKDSSPSCSPAPGIVQANYWSGMPFPPPGESSLPRDWMWIISCISRWILYP